MAHRKNTQLSNMMAYPFSACHGSNNATITTCNPFKTKFHDHLIDGKKTVSLLEAPPITRKAQWKLRSFMYCEAKVRPKLVTHSATSIILVFGQHFDVNTHVATAQAENFVEKFKSSFGDVKIFLLLVILTLPVPT